MNSEASKTLSWRKSSCCPNSATCVEIAPLPTGGAAIRDSKNIHGPEIHFSPVAGEAFITAVRAHEFDVAN